MNKALNKAVSYVRFALFQQPIAAALVAQGES